MVYIILINKEIKIMTNKYSGIFPAMQLPFLDDYTIDENERTRFSKWLISHDGVNGLVTNGHTGEIFSLTSKERAKVTSIVAKAVDGKYPIVSGLSCEGDLDAIEQGKMAVDAGASSLLVMPPHHWLRFGMTHKDVIHYFTTIGKNTNLDLVVHIYPSWTKATYSSELLADLAEIEWVKCFKIGTREMSKYDRDLEAIKNSKGQSTILTCHDEYLLTSMVQGVDGALVGFASFIPDLITELYSAVKNGDLKKAQSIQKRINPLKDAVYASGEPSGDAHARMKAAMVYAGRLKSDTVRPPTEKPSGKTLEKIKKAVDSANLQSIKSAA
jgi:4-hydroxy-tetrahydrodipicolinate synthase